MESLFSVAMAKTFFVVFIFWLLSQMEVFLACYLLLSVSMQRVLGDGLLVVRKIENVASGPNNRPKLACIIAECGEM